MSAQPLLLTRDGETMSLHDWAHRLGMKGLIEEIRKDLRRATAGEDVPTARQYTWAGRTMSLKEWSRETGIGMTTLHGRIASGWSIERMLTTPVQEKCRHRGPNDARQSKRRAEPVRLTHDGRTLTIAEWARELGIRGHVIEVRIANGWSTARALATPTRTLRQN